MAGRYSSTRLPVQCGYSATPTFRFTSILEHSRVGLVARPSRIRVTPKIITFQKQTSLLFSWSPHRDFSQLRKNDPSDLASQPVVSGRSHSRTEQNDSPSSLSSSETTGLPLRENIYTLPNIITASRILACPILGWSILQGDFRNATLLLAYAGVSDWVDGYLARKYNMHTVLGTILDPAADKILMTTLVVTLAIKGLLSVPLAAIILGRDLALSISAFYIRYQSLPPPKTFMRYWDFSIPSAEVRPTMISKVNTGLQLALMAALTMSPLWPTDISMPLRIFEWIVAGTTVWSGAGYLWARDGFRYVARKSITKTSSKP
ncbi:CDP-alcohol phosphatidyltransferase-domain-containing protein [Cantharellus anzutake]|uniref:CDP-alcohol phosphatidyltransferase-domain-containing protein n=1 Tax=Cantharellus anzutake TaxID=1750568 RepID=UPI001907C79D|nr:CDP-alcohol phosphatidyltransferase-domain-containing protein [Cantharellus anzutake]XP_038918510.1 CDP-alcohol phosphatidyltransferase-domain-containing protein [Cantharellus anzutake]KAF8312562.1 CDP-alcohol phosphatidyltransferase-domain-containing protein [Cantharellus anzutake]KAF8335082.1 CDP-alcohol phosphatidyltransferase-domain-containing protein [Cantharellus anzutake]